jgi:hypothetical protein
MNMQVMSSRGMARKLMAVVVGHQVIGVNIQLDVGDSNPAKSTTG